ncbi:MAG: hypothetical protein WAT36_04800 [Chromatiaceae bacterium]
MNILIDVDINRAAQFEALFGHLAIGRNPKPRHNPYFLTNWLQHRA